MGLGGEKLMNWEGSRPYVKNLLEQIFVLLVQWFPNLREYQYDYHLEGKLNDKSSRGSLDMLLCF